MRCRAAGGSLSARRLAPCALAIDDRRAAALVLAFGAVVLLAAAAFRSRRRGRAVALVVGVVAVLGRGALGPMSAELAGTPSASGPWAMVVESTGPPREGQQVATLRTIEDGPAGFRVAATLPRYPPIEPGDVVEVGGRVRERPDSPYGQYLERIGAWGTLDARSLEVRHRPSTPATVLESIRRDAGELLTRVLPEPEAGLAAGILIGLRDRVDRAVASTFTTAGVSHIVAISGWNIAIVAAAIAAVAGRLGRRRRSVVTAAAIVAYIAFAGASPSVLRAGAMAGVVLLARESGRAGRAAAALGWAAALLLLVDPRLIVDAGFQLSTLATAGLIAWATPLTDRLDGWTGARLPRWLSESLGVSLAAQAATLPVVLASFGRLAVIAPAVNLLVVPLVAPAMAAGLVALGGGAIVALGAPSWVGTVLAAPGWVALRLIIGIVDVAAAVPLASMSFEPPIGLGLGLGSVALTAAVVAWRGRRPARPGALMTRGDRSPEIRRAPMSMPVRIATAGLIVAVAVAGAVAITRPGGVARVTVLDVGQGDAILVEGSRGGRLLIDGGPDPDRLLVELDRRIPPWDRRHRRADPEPPARGPCRGVRRCCSTGIGSGGCSSQACAAPGPATRHGSTGSAGVTEPPICRSPRATGWLSTTSTFASSGRSVARYQPTRPIPGRASTTCRSCCSGRSPNDGSSWRATSRRRSTRHCSRPGCRRWTSSRSPTTAAGRPPPMRSWRRSGHGLRSPRPGQATRTGTRRGRRSTGCLRPAPASTGRIATGR